MPYRVFQWASGTVGKHAANACLERSSLELVGLHAYSPAKLGKDVGELLGRAPTGVRVTGTLDAVLASNADVVIHTPLASLVYGENPEQDVEDICRLLAGGKNVITAVGYLYPKHHGPKLVERLEAACQAGKSTFHSTGLNPGFMGDLLPLLMSSLASRVDRVELREVSNFQYYPSPEIMFDAMGFGSPPEKFEGSNKRRKFWLDGLFGESALMVSDGIGLGVEKIDGTLETALASEDLKTAAGVVKRGTVAGQRYRWTGCAGGQQRLLSETVWRMHDSVAPEWPRGNHTITLEGTPRMHLELKHDFCSDGLLGTAMHAVNAIPAVCQAAPGIRTFLDLPWIFPAK
jgi:4-hydroxy-tetrahydrodipicolinate reductase